MTYTIRPSMEADYPAIVALINRQLAEPTTLEDFVHGERVRNPEDRVERLVVVTPEGELAAYGAVSIEKHNKPGHGHAQVRVDDLFGGKGLGSELLSRIEGWAKEQGAIRLESGVREDYPKSIAWIERRGWVRQHHLFSSTLSLPEWDPTPFMSAVEQANAEGIRFTTLAAEGTHEENLRRFYEISSRQWPDLPNWDDTPIAPYEEMRRWIEGNPGFKPEMIFLAAEVTGG
jgi:GNAT superfamily N-acetyltransferase